MGSLMTETLYSEIAATVEALDDAGLTRHDLKRIRKWYGLRMSLRDVVRSYKQPGPLHLRDAEEILGENFLGPLQYIEYFDVRLDAIKDVPDFPWGEDVLLSPCPFWPGRLVKDTHFAFLGLDSIGPREEYRLTLGKWIELIETAPGPSPLNSLSFDFSAFPPDPSPLEWPDVCESRWFLATTASVPRSESLDYFKQLDMLPVGYEIPTAMQEITKLILMHYRKRCPLESNRTRTEWKRGPLGIRIIVGKTAPHRMNVSYVDSAHRSHHLGITASRKYPE